MGRQLTPLAANIPDKRAALAAPGLVGGMGAGLGAGFGVAIPRWFARDEMAEAIACALSELGHTPLLFDARSPLPAGADVLFSFGPFGDFLALTQRVEALPAARRPIVVQWNTEGMPDLRIPWAVMHPLSRVRSLLGRATSPAVHPERVQPASRWPQTYMLRYRYVGDYYYARQRGLLDVFADLSAVYAEIHNRRGLPTVRASWGASPTWCADLGLTRDIDVVWMGKRGTRRRAVLLDRLRAELRRAGVEIYMVDNEERPFVFREERTELLNRAKIVLNLTRTWYDDNLVRFGIVAPNRALIVSEPLLPHCPEYTPGVHYVSVGPEAMAETIVHYLTHAEEREQIVDNAHRLVTEQLTMANSVRKILAQVAAAWQVRHG